MADVELLLSAGYDAAERGDLAHARRCFEQAAALGDPYGWFQLGLMHDIGEGVAADKDFAMRAYRRAWRTARHCGSANNIAILYKERGQHRQMAEWFRRGAEAGDGDAYFELAKCYRDGVGVRRSQEQTLRCLAAVLSSDYVCEDSVEQAEAMMLEFRPRAV